MTTTFLKIQAAVVSLLIAQAMYSCSKDPSAEYRYDNVRNPNINQQKSWFHFSGEAGKIQKILINGISGKVSIAAMEYSDASFMNAKERELFYLKSVYQRSTPPYAGAIQAKEECPSEFLPRIFPEVKEGGRRLFGFAAKGTEREKYGACDTRTAKKTFLKILIECEGFKSIYDLELFLESPDVGYAEMEKIFSAFTCDKNTRLIP